MPLDAMVDPKLTNSPGWWLSRLGRRLDARQTDMIRYADYYAGKHTMKFATQKFREAFGDLFREVAVNFCEVVVDKLVERLEVQGFRFSEGEAANAIAWGVWQRNDLDADFAKGIREGLTKGEFSMTVWVGPDGKPRLTVEDPINMIVSLDPSDAHTRRAALKRWYDPDLGSMFATLYLPDAIYKYESAVGDTDPYVGGYDLLRAAREQATWKRRVVEGEPWPIPNALGVVPVVAFPNKPDLAGVGVSELKNVLPIQDAFNKNISDMLLAGEFSAFRQRYAVNVELEINPDTGKPIEPWKIAVDRLLTAPPPTDPGQPEVKFGEFSQTDLGGYIEVGEMLLKDLAVITRMPPHYLLGSSGVFPSGEALALNTPVHTPDGPVPIGYIEVGDRVFDDRGSIQTVEHVFDVLKGRPCYRVLFDDGSAVVADAAHKWLTVDHLSRAKGRAGSVVTTEQIADTLWWTDASGNRYLSGRKHSGSYNHAIPVAAALEGEDIDLPIEPYALGVWLGDGTSVHADVTQHIDDAAEMIENLVAVGVSAAIVETAKPTTVRLSLGKVYGTDRCQRGHDRTSGTKCRECEHLSYRTRYAGDPLPERTNTTFRSKLIATGLIGAKHIPEVYYRASHRQRLALLQGLMDTDGSTTPGGSITLDLGDETLARSAHRLIFSLGHKCSLRRGREPRGRTGFRWRMAWTAPEPVFRMRRKLARQKFAKDNSASRFRYIHAVEPIESVPVRCIAVSGPSHLFLVGDSYIPTHNSLRAAETGLVRKAQDRMRDFSEPLEEVMRLVFLVLGDKAMADTEAETLWANPETRVESAHIDALTKMQSLGVPQEGIWEQIPASPTQIAHWKALAAEAAQRAADAALAAAPPPEPPQTMTITKDQTSGMVQISRKAGA